MSKQRAAAGSIERYDEVVKDLLRLGGMSKRHPDHEFFRVLLTGVCHAAYRRNRSMRALGEHLLKLTADGAVTPDAIASIRRIGEQLAGYNASPDMNAVRGIHIAMGARVKRVRSNKNLRRPRVSVTNKQIRAESKSGTRAEQADRLGISERQLARRLKQMKG